MVRFCVKIDTSVRNQKKIDTSVRCPSKQILFEDGDFSYEVNPNNPELLDQKKANYSLKNSCF
jgi:hypothetical protein